ncbi:TetR/AcrR family transcriptional regulator [Actinoplanes sp. DH11]|uniref:TetR/AcrR family transcriptional regulator n=1 Tax=Actinoplanes sp. DH11 TaxID=2857011 RepID=UPI001E2B0B00|nr:TetR/AcrR family transcriptional regulator [Actinoplanes sp. DH11]
MSPRAADPHIRTLLVEAAARILAEEGPAALTSRRLAIDIGTSTMTVFSRFRNMAELHSAVREEGFSRLNSRIDELPATDDPVADLVATGSVFFASGVDNPHLYRAMFLDPPPEEDALGAGTYERLLDLVRRCLAAGRFTDGQDNLAPVWAAQLWSMRHGMVTMTVSGMLPSEQARFVLDDMTFRLLVGYGDDPAHARESIERGRVHAA